MELLRFRVTDFRSVADSGWIDIGKVTALIGENESDKTNVLLPLWKLNPSGDGGEVDPIADYPRARYNDFRDRDDRVPGPISYFCYLAFRTPRYSTNLF